MKTISAALEAHLAQDVTTLATCWRATLRDSRVFGFTDHVRDLLIDGVTYQAAAGYTPTAIASNASLAVDHLEVEGLLDSAAITEADLATGRWDHASVEIFQVNYADLGQGVLRLRKGRLGEVRSEGDAFTADLRGMLQALDYTIGELYSPICRADLGDARCGVNLAPRTVTSSVVAVTSNEQFAASGLGADSRFAGGRLTWTAGANTGLSMEVKAQASGAVSLVLPMPHPIAVGDTFSVAEGCDKLFATCQHKFGNALRFRGEPHVPGTDAVLRGPR